MITSNLEQVKSLALQLFEINAFKFGDFKMKIGINSPVYFDLRIIISYPEVMEAVSNLIITYFNEHKLNANRICGVPYTALPLATLVSLRQKIPMLFRRKEPKSYGTKRLIEGVYHTGDTCIIIEDVITSGSSVLDTARDLQREGIIVTDVVVLVDREQGGTANIERHSIKVHSLLSLSFLIKTLVKAEKLQSDIFDSITKYIRESQIDEKGNLTNKPIEIANHHPRWKIPFEERASLAKCDNSRSLFHLMASKKTNLCLAADVTKTADVLDIAEKCGPYICILKIHVDILEDFHEDFINNLKRLAKNHNFMLMEDRKFSDIGHTVSLQYHKGLYKISNWADLITVHSISGSSILQALTAGDRNENSKNCGVFIVAEMSSHNNLINEEYKEKSIKMAMDDNHETSVAGIVCQSSDCFSYPGLIQLTPGVKIHESVDQLGQVYNTPEYVVKEKWADICVVGRGILESKSIPKTAALYRDRLWAAYVDRLSL